MVLPVLKLPNNIASQKLQYLWNKLGLEVGVLLLVVPRILDFLHHRNIMEDF